MGPGRRRRSSTTRTTPSPSSRCGVPARPRCAVRVTDTGGLSSTNSLGIEITEPATTLTFSPPRTRASRRTTRSTTTAPRTGSGRPRSAEHARATCGSRCPASPGEIRSAKLRLTASSTDGTVDGPGVHAVTGDWTESGGHVGHQARRRRRPGVRLRRDRREREGGVGRHVARERQRPARPRARSRRRRTASEFLSKEASNAGQAPGARGHVRDPVRRPGADRARRPHRRGGRLATSTSAWTASTDNVGVTNYEIYRDGELLAVTGNVTSYTDTTASESRPPYEYTVKALDQNENRSDASNTASATVPDTQSPTEPENLQRHGKRRPGRPRPGTRPATTSASRATASTAATPRSAASTARRPSYTDTGLDAGPHTFTVRAIDAAGNLSEPEQHRDGDRAGHGQAVRAEQPERHRRPRPGRPHLDRLHGQRGRHRLPDLPERHPGRQRRSARSRRSPTPTCSPATPTTRCARSTPRATCPTRATPSTVNVPDAEKPTAPWFLRATAGHGPGRAALVRLDRQRRRRGLPDLPQRHRGRDRRTATRAPTSTPVSWAR